MIRDLPQSLFSPDVPEKSSGGGDPVTTRKKPGPGPKYSSKIFGPPGPVPSVSHTEEGPGP